MSNKKTTVQTIQSGFPSAEPSAEEVAEAKAMERYLQLTETAEWRARSLDAALRLGDATSANDLVKRAVTIHNYLSHNEHPE